MLSSLSHYFYWFLTPGIWYSYRCIVTNYWFKHLSFDTLIFGVSPLHWWRHQKSAKIWCKTLMQWAHTPSPYTTHNYLPLEKGGALYLNKLESPSPKDAWRKVLLKLAQWIWRRSFFNFINVFLNYLPLESLWLRWAKKKKQ